MMRWTVLAAFVALPDILAAEEAMPRLFPDLAGLADLITAPVQSIDEFNAYLGAAIPGHPALSNYFDKDPEYFATHYEADAWMVDSRTYWSEQSAQPEVPPRFGCMRGGHDSLEKLRTAVLNGDIISQEAMVESTLSRGNIGHFRMTKGIALVVPEQASGVLNCTMEFLSLSPFEPSAGAVFDQVATEFEFVKDDPPGDPVAGLYISRSISAINGTPQQDVQLGYFGAMTAEKEWKTDIVYSLRLEWVSFTFPTGS